jgi:hypothetical protein
MTASAHAPDHAVNKPGYRYVPSTVGKPSAVLCGANSYSAGFNKQKACTPCRSGMKTDPAATGLQTSAVVCSECLAASTAAAAAFPAVPVFACRIRRVYACSCNSCFELLHIHSFQHCTLSAPRSHVLCAAAAIPALQRCPLAGSMLAPLLCAAPRASTGAGLLPASLPPSARAALQAQPLSTPTAQ